MEIPALVSCLLSVLPVWAYLSMQQYSSCNANAITGYSVETRHWFYWNCRRSVKFRLIPFDEICISSSMLVFWRDLWNLIGKMYRTWSGRFCSRSKGGVEEVCQHQFTSPSAFSHPLSCPHFPSNIQSLFLARWDTLVGVHIAWPGIQLPSHNKSNTSFLGT